MDKFVEVLAQALKEEFPFVMGLGIQADDESWKRAAQGIVNKMGISCETGDISAVTRFYVNKID